MKNLLLILFVNLVFLASFSSASEKDSEPLFATVKMKNVLLYESPSTASAIIRRVFEGEVLKIVETVKTEQGEIWGKVVLSPNQAGYLQGVYFVNGGSLQQQMWKPEEVLRSQMPFSFAAKGTAELFGPGLQFRYLPFTRLGITVGAGSTLDNGRLNGFTYAYGLTFLLSTKSLSPFVETGTSTLTLTDGQSTLRISSFYINAGVEWILRSGYFVGLGISYNRSYNVQVSFDYSYAKASNGNLSTGNYGSFTGLDGSESLQKLDPIFLAGYSF
jgi:opacity protein-like surface antigen